MESVEGLYPLTAGPHVARHALHHGFAEAEQRREGQHHKPVRRDGAIQALLIDPQRTLLVAPDDVLRRALEHATAPIAGLAPEPGPTPGAMLDPDLLDQVLPD